MSNIEFHEGMTYSEFRESFARKEDFERAYGALTEEQVRTLISNEPGCATVKAAKFSTWRRCHEHDSISLMKN